MARQHPENDDTRTRIMELLRNARLNAGTAGKALVLTEVAARSGISIGTLSEAERGIRLTWRTIKGHIEACTGLKTKSNTVLATAERLWDQYQAENTSGATTLKDATRKRARAYWKRHGTLEKPSSIKTHEQGLICLGALREHQGLSLRELATAVHEQTDYTYNHSTLGQVINGNSPLAPDHLRAILIGCQVPEAQWESWSAFFAKHAPGKRDRHDWALAPTPARIAHLHKEFADTLEHALDEQNATAKGFAALTQLDMDTIRDLFDGKHVPRHVISRAAHAAASYGVPRQEMDKLHSLTRMLQQTAKR